MQRLQWTFESLQMIRYVVSAIKTVDSLEKVQQQKQKFLNRFAKSFGEIIDISCQQQQLLL